MLEKNIQAAIIKQLEKSGWLVIKLIQTTMNGIPDLLALRDGTAVFIEVKRPGGKVSPLQTFRIEQIKEKHFQVIVAYHQSDVNHLCQESSEKQQKYTPDKTSQSRQQTLPSGQLSHGKSFSRES